jgi:uncharacterized membrane protein YbaN (DUF454 family)
MANPEPAADLRPAGQFPSDGGSVDWDIAGETDAISSAPLRWLLLATGLVFVGLAVLGAVLPVLPTVPFLLVAAACFARSSTRFYQWLLSNRVLGPLIRDWRETRTIPLRAKVSAIAAVALVGGSSVLFYVANPWAKLGVGVILIGLIGFQQALSRNEGFSPLGKPPRVSWRQGTGLRCHSNSTSHSSVLCQRFVS